MKVKEFIKLLKTINPEANFLVGNFYYYSSGGENNLDYVNIDGDELKILEDDATKIRKIKKVKKCILWCSE